MAILFIRLTNYAPIAQLVEQLPFKEMVEGSIPPERTNLKNLTFV